MSFSLPTAWEQLSQEQLRYVLRLLWLYGEAPDWEQRVKVAAFHYFAGVETVKRTEGGWLCREIATSRTFLLNNELLPSIVEPLEFICKTDTLTVRIERVGDYEAYDFLLQTLPFGNFLVVEGYYQSYLQSHNDACLVNMAKVLYHVEDDNADLPEFESKEVLFGVFLWFCAAKRIISEEFPNFYKPASETGEPITRELLIGSMRAQMRLLTKGDVTKEQYIREKVDTWTALAELDASAKESDELNQKYGKH